MIRVERKIRTRLLVAAAGALALAGSAAQAALIIPLGGTGPNAFGGPAAPTVAEGYSTTIAATGLGGSTTVGADPATMDAFVQARSIADYASPLPVPTGSNPPTTSVSARFNSTLLALQTKPTTNANTALLLTLENGTGSTLTDFTLTYDLGMPPVAQGEVALEQLAGQLVYTSPTGAAGSWTRAAHLTTAGPVAVPVTGLSLAQGSLFYVMITDDNADAAGVAGAVDQGHTIDNLAVTPGVPEPTALGAIGVAAVGLIARRRRRD